MLHLIFEGNKDLNNRTFPLPKGIRNHLYNTLHGYSGDKTVDGYKRLNNVLNMNTISYQEMKRIKNFFDNYKGTPKSSEFILNGGEPMMNWVNNTLNTATTAIKDFKQAKKDAGMPNAFIKPHEKQRQIRKDKPTQAKIQSKDVAKKIGDNNAIRFEHKERKTIYISENVYKQLTTENINEGWKNWAMAGALGAVTMFGGNQTANAQSNNGGVQRGTYWELTKGQNKPQQLTKEDIKPIMQNIKAVTDNLTDYANFINAQLSKLNPQQRNEVEKAILGHCVKNQNTGKLINSNSFNLEDASYIKQVYDTGDNIMSLNIGGKAYFVTVSAVNEAMMIMGLQQGTPSVVKMFSTHK